MFKSGSFQHPIPYKFTGLYRQHAHTAHIYRTRSNCSRTKLSRMQDFTIFAVFIFADAQVPNIILHLYAIYVI